MKTITRTNIYLPMAAMILTAALAIPAAAQTQVPFKGTFQGNDTVIPPTITTAATGIGTLVGQLSLTDSTFVASAVPGDVVFTVTEIHAITGGTGRFSGAQGSFTVHRTHVVAPSADGTHVTFGWFEGTITSPGAAH
jgi:hypothetical protein